MAIGALKGVGRIDAIGGGQMRIGDNVLVHGNMFIPLDSISKVQITKQVGQKYKLSWFVMILIGFLLVISSRKFYEADGTILIFGLALIGIGGFLIWSTYQANNNPEWYLVVSVSSSEKVYFVNKDRDWLVKVGNVLLESINDRTKGYTIQMGSNNHIETANFGSGNVLNKMG